MELFVTGLIIFIVSFFIFCVFVYKSEKFDGNSYKSLTAILVALIFAIIISVTIMVLILVLMGSTSLLTGLFKLKVSYSDIITIGIVLVISNLFADNIIVILIRHILSERILITLAGLALYRFCLIVIAGSMLNIKESDTLVLALGISSIIMFFELIIPYWLNAKDDKNGNVVS